VILVRQLTALYGLLFFGIGRPASSSRNAWREEHDKEVFKGLRSMYPFTLCMVAAYRLLLALAFESSLAFPVPLDSIISCGFTLPLSLYVYANHTLGN
jgi:hypothetical protein